MAAPEFTEAIAYAESRAVVLPDEYYGKLVGVHRAQAVSIAGLAQLEQIKFVIDAVAEALREGSTFKQFQDKVAASELKIDLPKYRLDNIFRTNIQVAYNKGRYTQQVKSSTRGYWLYDAVNDSRVRPTHLAMDGVILPKSDPWWGSHYPPCGYRCRCVVVSLTEKQAARRGITADPPDVAPDAGWDFNPGVSYGEGVKRGLDGFGAAEGTLTPRAASLSALHKRKTREAAEAAEGKIEDAPKRSK